VKYIYKITSCDAWRDTETTGVFLGSGIDLSDRYIHFSTAQQVEETAARHFSGLTDLLLIRVEASRLGPALKWEVSRGGEKFPHLYAPLMLKDVDCVSPLKLRSDHRHDFSGLLK
jgi:uncharacterized protein (DUF952 family)